MKKRLLAYLLILAMVLTLAPQPKAHAAVSSDETAHVHEHEHAEVNAEGTKATKKGTVLTFSSDVHNTSGNSSANRMNTWIDNVESKHGEINAMGFGGDMAGASYSGSSSFWTNTQADMDVLNGQGVKGVYTTGNHEYSMGGDFSYTSYTNGSYSSTETKGQYKINTIGDEGDDYIIYCLGSVSSSSSYSSQNQISTLTSFLSKAGNDKVIFIITHFPLHQYGSRTTTGASDVIDALNAAVENNGQTIVFLWGHNHTESDTYYDQIYGPGGEDSIKYSSNGTKTIKFYYGAAGCMSDSDYGTGSGYVKGKGLAVTFNDAEGTMNFAYYNASGTDVTESNSVKSVTIKTVEPVPATSVTIDESVDTGDDGQPVTVSQTVAKGGTLQLHVTFEPANSTSTVTWTSSNEAIATVDANGLVTGKSAGTATITATVADSAKKAVVAATLDVTVAQMYVQTNSLVAGKDYLIASGNSGDVLLLTNEETGTAKQLKSASATVSSDGKLTIDSVEEAKVLFSCVANSNSSQGGFWLTNGGQYLYADSSNGLRLVASSTQTGSSNNTKSWHYKGDSKNLLWFFKDTSSQDGYTDTSSTYRYYLDYSAGEYFTDAHVESGSSLSNTETPAVYLFVEDDGTTPEDPPAGKTVSVTPASSNSPEESVTIAVGETLTINVTNGSSSSAYNFTATLSNSGIAQINGSTTINITAGSTGAFTVEGVANGTVDINISNDGSYSTRKATIHLTVGDGGTTPVDPPAGETVDITPSTSNPEVSATINVDDTLIINVTNGSSREAYDFTASLSDTGIAEIQGSNPVNIAAGAIGQFTVKGLANGTVDINIQNNQSSSSYQRKGVVHLTVEGSSTPVAVTGVEVTPESATVKVGKTTTLTATVAPTNATNKNVTWSSSNANIASVDTTGKVTGVAVGTATITVTTEDGNFTDSCEVTVEEAGLEYYVIKIGNYIMSCNLETDYMTNTSGYEYYGLKAVTYDANAAAPYNTLWLLEETDTQNGYYIKSASGQYLSATYERNSSSSGYTGTLTVGTTKDIWVATSGFDTWELSGSTLKSSNASVNANNNKEMFLAVNAGDGGTDFFSIRSSSNAGTSQLIEPEETADPVHVTGVTVSPTTATITVGKTTQLTATVTPEDADNKAVTWESSDNTKATVDENGLVTAVAEGTVTITVKSVDDPTKTATCTITIEASTETRYELVSSLEDGGEYLIVSANSGSAYALKNPGGNADGVSIANANYRTSVTIESGNYILTSDTDIVWTASVNGDGFNLTNGSDYLEGASNAVRSFNPQKYSSRYWTYNSSNQLRHINPSSTSSYYTLRYSSSGYFTGNTTTTTGTVYLFKKAVPTVDPEGITVSPTTLNLTEGETSTLTATVTPADANKNVTWTSSDDAVATVENGVVTAVGAGTATITAKTVNNLTATCSVTVTAAPKVDYVQTDSLVDGEEYLIVYGNTGEVYILSTDENGSRTLKGIAANVVNGKISITSSVAAKTLFKCEIKTSTSGAVSAWLKNEAKNSYLYTDSSNGLRLDTTQTSSSNSGKYWHYKAEDKHLLWYFKDTSSSDGYDLSSGNYRYYLECSGGNFTDNHVENTSLAATSTPAIYLFVKDDGTTPHEHTYGTPTYTWSDDNTTCTATAVCTGCDAGTEGHEVNETVTAQLSVTQAATCTAAGSGTYTATFTNNLFTTQTKTVEIPMIAHDLEHHEAAAATCTAEGNIEYWQCSVCHKYFSDAAGTNEITQAQIVTAMIAHDLEHHDAVAATCTTAGNTEYWQCTMCHKYFSDAAGTTEITQADTVVATDPDAHSWKLDAADVVWNWDGVASATATFTCANDASHTQAVNATITPSEGTGENAGYTVYTATVSFSGNTYTATKRVINQYDLTIHYVYVGGSTASEDYTATVTYGESYSVASPAITGYTADTATVSGTMGAADVEVTVIYTANTYTVKFNKNASDATGTMDDQTFTYDVSQSLKANAFSRSGYSFSGWATSASGGVEYVNGASVKNLTATNGGEVTLYAVWASEAYYLIGDHIDPAWDINENYVFTASTNGEYVLRTTLAEGDKIKAARAENGSLVGWYPDGTGNEYTVDAAHAGSVTVYFRTTYNADWSAFGGYIYIEKDHTIEIQVEPAGKGTAIAKNPSGIEVTTAPTSMQITIDATPANAFYELDKIELQKKGSNDPAQTVNGTSFTMPAYDVIVTVYFKEVAHDWNTPTYEWAEDNSTVTATRVCKNDASHVETETATATSEVTTQPTCTTMGKTTYTATFTNEAFTTQTKTVENINALEHDWDTPTYSWSNDNTTVTATRVCKRDGNHKETETVSATSEITTPATCTATGVKTWTSAAFTNPAFTAQTKTETIPVDPEAHDWNEEPSIVWAADYTSVTVTFTCKNDTANAHPHVVTYSGSDISVTTVPATGTTAGSITYTAPTITFNGKTYEVTKTVEIPALGTYTVSGTVTSYTSNHTADADKVVTLVLSKNGTEVARTTVNTTEANYSFNSVEAGTYTLTVSKRDHVTRTYTLNVSAATTQNVVINLLGDVNGDGKVSTIDAALANWHVQGTKPITDAYTLAVADLNGNGEVSTVEVGQINSHARKLAVIWDLY